MYVIILHTNQIFPTGMCWLWTASLDKKGYGKFPINENGKMKLLTASRFMYLYTYKTLPDDKEVCHSCDNPLCVNPEHLFLGSHNDNVQDMVKKNRQAKGSNNGLAKLTENDVETIRQLHVHKLTYKQLAERFNVSKSTIGLIIRNETWRQSSMGAQSRNHAPMT